MSGAFAALGVLGQVLYAALGVVVVTRNAFRSHRTVPRAREGLRVRGGSPQGQRLLSAVHQLSGDLGVRPPRVYVSPRRGEGALVCGVLTGRQALVVQEGLLSRPDRELHAALAHELSHLRRHHLQASTLVLLLEVTLPALLRTVLLQSPALESALGAWTAAVLLGLVLEVVVRVLGARLARAHEHHADSDAVRLTGAALADLLVRTGRRERTDAWSRVLATHPDPARRAARVRVLAAEHSSQRGRSGLHGTETGRHAGGRSPLPSPVP